MKTKGSVLGGILLIGGTCIGAGMLGLPVMTAAAGFFPTMGAFLFVWFFMTASAFAYLEVSLRFKGEVNLISIVATTMGSGAKWFAWVTYVLFLYSLMAAYTAGGTTIFANLINVPIHGTQESIGMALLFMIPFALVVFMGTWTVDIVNRLLMAGLIATFVALCATFLGPSHTSHFNGFGESKYLLFTFPLLVTSFGYHTIIPTLKSYLHEDIKKLRIVFMIGGLSPLVIYAIWELIILYLIPTWGDNGLVFMLHHAGANPADAMAQALSVHGSSIHHVVAWFSYFALTSSFIGVGLGIRDFFADGLHIKKNVVGSCILTALTFAPPLIYTIVYPRGFLFALKYAGVFAAILLIIYPVLMAWRARYVTKLEGKYKMWGGKMLLLLTLLFGLFVVFADVLLRMGVLPIPV
ncbi:MAG TPA: aromatic amino acid transport family protein [Gammaproteobacteria bacterium]|nr:aromatic amino acid transport family protein [Gammaproteobacteria bacterium]